MQNQIHNQTQFSQRKPEKFNLSRTVLLLAIVAAILSLVGIIYVIKWGGVNPLTDSPERRFASCQTLAKNCLDVTQCKWNVYCGDEMNKEDCGVYDCGKEYGVYVKLKGQNDFIYKNVPKADLGAVQKLKEACAGKMEVLSDKCVNGVKEIKYRLETAAECKIVSTDLRYSETRQEPTELKRDADGTYVATGGTCEAIQRVVPVAESGLALSF